MDTNTGIGRTIAFIEAYAERRATEARIAILSKVDPLAGMMILRPDGMEHEIKVMDYVTELKAALTKEIQSS